MTGLRDVLLVAPELTLIVGGLAILMIGAFRGDRDVMLYTTVALATLGAAAAIVVLHGGQTYRPFSGTLKLDAFSDFGRLLIYGATAMCVALSGRQFRGGTMRAEYPALLLFSAVGMGLMVSASDLITLYIGLELTSLASYVLASFLRSDTRSAEAGLKYFVLGALASGILLYGMSLLYGFAGSTEFAAVAAALGDDRSIGLLVGIVFVLAGLSFKISAVPFHMWTPDVYEGAPTPVTAFFATAPKIAAVALLARVCMEALGPATDAWRQIIAFLAIASILLGAVGAIGQRNVKRLLAYSSINNVGFMLIGIAAGTVDGIAAVLAYLLVYAVTTLGSFLIVMQLRDASGATLETLDGYAGLIRREPLLATAFAVFLFSLAGIPPLFGFWPKFLVFDAAMEAGLTGLAVVGAVGSVIGAYYYLALIKRMFLDDPTDAAPVASSTLFDRSAIVTSAALLAVVGYFFITPLDTIARHAAGALF